MIDRRTFLRRLGFGTVSAAAAVCTFDVEKLLWVPGEKSIFLPSVLPLDFDSFILDPHAMRVLMAANLNLFNPSRDLFRMVFERRSG